MILYFSDRFMNILGHASTSLRNGLTVKDDLKTEDTESGVAVFECVIPYDEKTLEQVESCTQEGNYILRYNGKENEFYTIIESEKDTKTQEIYLYAEDAGLDLLNEVVGAYTADKAYNIAHYVNMFTFDSGFEIGINEVANLTRTLSWEGEATATERIASVATQFDNCEISYSFEVKGLEITKKLINIHKKRGQDIGIQLRLNKEVDRIITKKSIKNLATALECTGGTPENSEIPITLNGYKYDDGDFFVSGNKLLSREALKKWSRYIWTKEPSQIKGQDGHIVRRFSYDTLSQETLCKRAITELKELREIEVNYEVDITRLPDNVRIGDRVNIIDDAGGLYLSTRILKFETSVCDKTQTATLGEHLLKDSGISQTVEELAQKLAENALSAKRAQEIANAAKEQAQEAQTQADSAKNDAQLANTAADEAKLAADNATASSQAAQEAANAAQDAVTSVEESVSGIEETVNNAQAAADNAWQAAQTAETKAEEAKTAAGNAQTKAEEAATAAGNAQTAANSAVEKATTAEGTATTAKTQADEAKATADAAKIDAAEAQKEIDSLSGDLTTLSNTMTADYARKTDLTEATASLQTQISQNAGQIETTAKKVTEIDETANNAQELSESASALAAQAKAEADAASADATLAQSAADAAKLAANAAQAEADKAKAAADTAQGVASKAETDLAAAKADLETVTNRVGATEEEIAEAQAKVDTAQAAADKAKADAATATQKAADAQGKADTAFTNASNAQSTADDALAKATIAQTAADAAKGDAAAAQATADEAKTNAATAKATADTAKADAETAQTKANEAAAAAGTAQAAADDAKAKVTQAQADLDLAEQNLATVSGKVDATKEEVEAAQAAVDLAQAAADKAKADAALAQSTADAAKQDATNAQNAANTAKSAADAAQAAADAAQDAADAAQDAVDALEIRTTTAETKITQNAEAIKLAATKEEVSKTLGGYYTKEQADAAIKVSADGVKTTVSNTYATKQEVNGIEIGGRNLILNTKDNYNLNGSDYVAVSKRDLGRIETLSTGVGNAYRMFYNEFSIPITELGSEKGKNFTFSIDIKAVGTFENLRASLDFRTPTHVKSLNCVARVEKFGEWARISATGTTLDVKDVDRSLINIAWSDSSIGSVIEYKNIKFEVGTKATAWTPAHEDVEQQIDDEISGVRETITEQATEIENTCNAIIMSALKSYTETGDFNSFKETTESELKLLSESLALKFTKTIEELEKINGELQGQINTITKHFEFDFDGMTIGQSDSPYKITVDHDDLTIYSNGEVVQQMDALGRSLIPELYVTRKLNALGGELTKDGNIVSFDLVGGV